MASPTRRPQYTPQHEPPQPSPQPHTIYPIRYRWCGPHIPPRKKTHNAEIYVEPSTDDLHLLSIGKGKDSGSYRACVVS